MNTASLIGSVSRQAGGLFESVRRLHQELLAPGGWQLKGINPAAGKGAPNIGVSVLGMIDRFTAADHQAWAPVRVHPFPVWGPREFGYAPGLARQLHRLNPDLVHVHGLWQFPSLVSLRRYRRTSKPYIISPHGMLDPWALKISRLKKRLAWSAYEKAHLGSAACVRALCLAEAEAIRALGIVAPICIIPNGVDLPQPQTQAAAAGGESYNWQELLRHRRLLLYLGRIHPKKGLVPLLRAWAQVRQQRSNWILAIAGWDQNSHEYELKSLADELELPWTDPSHKAVAGASVIFLGPQFGPAKRQWLEWCDAFILPSFSEGLPMSILEAWAHAKPVLMSRQCHLPEGVSAGAAMPLEPDALSIAQALGELFRLGESTLGCMGKCGQALVAEKFAWPKISAELKRVYLWMLKRGPKPDCVLDY